MDNNVYVKKKQVHIAAHCVRPFFCTRGDVVRDINSLTKLARIELVLFYYSVPEVFVPIKMDFLYYNKLMLSNE